MNSRAFLVIGVLVGAAVVYLLTQGRGPARTAPLGTQASVPVVDADASEGVVAGAHRVAFVDLTAIFNSCKQSKAFVAELNKLLSDGKSQLEPLEKELLALQEKHRMLAAGSPERAALEAELKQKEEAHFRAAEPWGCDLNRRRLVRYDQIYRTIQDVSGRVAKARGFDLVLADIEDPRPNLDVSSSRDLENSTDLYMSKVHRKSVLYAAREVDLTREVLEAVNAEP